MDAHRIATRTPTASTDRHRTVRVGTFADGQRATALTVTYAPVVGSFADVDRG